MIMTEVILKGTALGSMGLLFIKLLAPAAVFFTFTLFNRNL